MFQEIADAIKQALLADGVPTAILEKIQISEPPNPEMGDLAIPTFALAAHWGVKPLEATIRTQKVLNAAAHPAIASTNATGPYLNITFHTAWIILHVVKPASIKKQSRPRVMFEYSQPNTHKEFHIGHMRNACHGSALVNIWRAVGRNVIAATYNNDVGAHVAKTLWAYKKFHATEKPPREKGRWLAGMYVEATTTLEAHPEFKEEVSDVLRKLETSDKSWHKLWKETRRWSLDEFQTIYRELGLTFDATFNESAVKERGHAIVDDLLKRGIAKQSDGAIIMDFTEQKKGVLILRKSDGAGNYTTSDLALAQEKFRRHKLDECVILTDNRQDLYFQQLFLTLHAYGFTQKLTHLSYDLVTLPEGAMSSRKGNVVLYESLRDEVVEAATTETKKRHPDWSARKIERNAHALAIAAIKFTMVRTSAKNIIVFDKKEMLAFDGYTAPYLEYTLARINSIFKKSRASRKTPPKNYTWNADEHTVWLKLARAALATQRAATANDPSELAKYAFELAKLFASYYECNRVLDDNTKIRAARLSLVAQIKKTLEQTMHLLGLPLIKEM
ncbi:MAG: arginine--tRNA ligase [Candidatus Magasanikbacteria bacterium RIFCSPHIGHO2_02_FULL_50_9b]|uniref:Arginine--tRNA ligase n=1 Tax=Candidatus Magasanikbacteria bacterium RIFCSPHIGHO2_02_FULL_50_9b TaxID=1798682 RepID=A0A1F6M8F2_9BACT|nr:MAG: arginine--tRNA ligase [Candidatus Magasanikbacteria bacterium RIFCSPHIGHO2_02_FULL_50_9b]